MFNKIILIFTLLFLFQMPIMAVHTDDDCDMHLKARRKPTKEVNSYFCCCFTSCFKKAEIDTQESSVQEEFDQGLAQNRPAVTVAVVPINRSEDEQSSEEISVDEGRNSKSLDSSEFENFTYKLRTFSYQLVPASEVDLFTESVDSDGDDFFDPADNDDYLTRTANTLLDGKLRFCNIGNFGRFGFLSDVPTFEVPDNTTWLAKIMKETVVEFVATLSLHDDKIFFDEEEYQEGFPKGLENATQTYNIFLVPAEEFS